MFNKYIQYKVLFFITSLLAGCVTNQNLEIRSSNQSAHRSIPVGELIGYVHENRAHAWLGVPYAKPPIGDLRWKAPRPKASWEGVLNATEFGSPCTQIGSTFGDPEAKVGSVHGSEDCLYLNIFAPLNIGENEKLPVMLWIHGGSNTIGTSKLYDPSVLASTQRVIVVTLNYRLGIFGWFYHPSIKNLSESLEDGSGNYGTLDQIQSLKWIRQNISHFGGDKENITIFGESAGGHNVYTLLFSPLADGLFHKAISQSGSTKTLSIDQAVSIDDSIKNNSDGTSSKEILNQLIIAEGLARDRNSAIEMQNSMQDYEVVNFLRNQTKEQIISTYYNNLDNKDYMHKVINDGYVVPTEGMNFTSDKLINVPIIMGTNRDEMKLFLAFDPEFTSQRFSLTFIKDQDFYDISSEYGSEGWKVAAVDKPASELALNGNDKVFGYRFDWDEEPKVFLMDFSRILGAAHAIEIPFIMGGLELGGLEDYMFDEDNIDEAKKLSLAMMSYWSEFAYNGDPGSGRNGELKKWEPWSSLANSSKFLIIDTPNDGGLRMEKQALSYDSLVEKLLLDDRIPNDSIRCVMLDKAIDADWEIDKSILKSGLCDGIN
jgi:para-nitrobenzyl esterase